MFHILPCLGIAAIGVNGNERLCFGSAAAVAMPEEDDDEDVEQKGTVEDAAALAIAAQPTGFTLATTSVQTEVCFVRASDCCA